MCKILKETTAILPFKKAEPLYFTTVYENNCFLHSTLVDITNYFLLAKNDAWKTVVITSNIKNPFASSLFNYLANCSYGSSIFYWIFTVLFLVCPSIVVSKKKPVVISILVPWEWEINFFIPFSLVPRVVLINKGFLLFLTVL